MKKILVIFLLTFYSVALLSQNKSGNTFVFGGGGMYAQFVGDTSRPTTGELFPVPTPTGNYIFFTSGHSNICDSATGKLLMLCNGYVLYDTLGNIIENGDSLVPEKIYTHNSNPNAPNTQGSLILPKGSNGLYYIFTPTITDSAYIIYVTGGQNKVPYDLLQYHVVDMNANGGAGKVIQKNIPLLRSVEMCKTGMMACRHVNGYDWWLLKQALDTNLIYTFLVTKDTVLLDTIQGFATSKFGYYDLAGQSCFSTDGSKYAFATGGTDSYGAHLFIFDFDRCYGLLSNPKEIYIPRDSSLTPLDGIYGPYFDALITGLAFSKNDSFLYVSRRYTIYQYEINNPDTSTACYLVKQGPDTTYLQFAEYGQLLTGVDGRIYIGKRGGTGTQNSVIDYPDLKGIACAFCRKCLRYDAGGYPSNSPANMPDFNLGKKEPCWPLSTKEIIDKSNEIMMYPNPANDKLIITGSEDFSTIKILTLLSQLVYEQKIKPTKRMEISVADLSAGVYFVNVDGRYFQKLVVEK